MDVNDRRKRAAEEAAEWLILLQGEIPRSEREKYVDWLRESSVHVAEMLRVSQMHDALVRFQAWGEGNDSAPKGEHSTVVPLKVASSPERPRGMQSTKRTAWIAIAAGTLAASALIWWPIVSGQVIQTDRGERREVALADGSVVQIDPETRLRVAFEAAARRVFLERGRALFRVAKNPKRPFLVQAEHTTVRAVGTAFAVERGGESVIVTVAEGRVGVYPSARSVASDSGPSLVPKPEASHTLGAQPSHAPAHAAGDAMPSELPHGVLSNAASASAPEIFLNANEQVTIAASGSPAPVRDINSARALAWAEGRLVFEDSSLAAAVAQFNRYNRIQLSILDPRLAQRRISGVFSAADPESFVAFIQSVTVVRVMRDEATGIRIDSVH